MNMLLPKASQMTRAEERRYMDTFRHAEFCEGCGKANDGTIVPAHLNVGFGGMRMRGAVAALCKDCHDLADGRVKALPIDRALVWVRVCQRLLVDRATDAKYLNIVGKDDD